MIRITVSRGTCEIIPYTSKKDGSAQQLRKQEAYAHLVDLDGNPDLYPEKFGFLLNRDMQPFASGEYVLHPSGFYVRDGKLLFTDSRLTPAKPAIKNG